MTCDICQGKVVASAKKENWFVCEYCGTEYPLEWMKAKFQKTQTVRLERIAQLKNQPLWLGGLEWCCLAVEADRALYITKNIVEERAYHKPFEYITWEDCTLRQYLNGEFLRRFSLQEQATIMATTLPNDNSTLYNQINGGNTTRDKIFLLSLAEARKYFSSNGDRVAKYKSNSSWWWLRSPGGRQVHAADVGTDGSVHDLGHTVIADDNGVRPALWLKLESVIAI